MKNVALLLVIAGCFFVFSCKEKESERFGFLTDPIWVPDSLLANGIDARGPAGILAQISMMMQNSKKTARDILGNIPGPGGSILMKPNW